MNEECNGTVCSSRQLYLIARSAVTKSAIRFFACQYKFNFLVLFNFLIFFDRMVGSLRSAGSSRAGGILAGSYTHASPWRCTYRMNVSLGLGLFLGCHGTHRVGTVGSS